MPNLNKLGVKFELLEACSGTTIGISSAEILIREHRSLTRRDGNGGEGEDVKLVRRCVLLEYSRLGVLAEL